MYTDPNNPYVPKAHRAALAASAHGAVLDRASDRYDGKEREFSAYIAAGGRGLDSNYPRELNALIESESDIHMRQNATYRNMVREHLVGAKLADSRHGVQDWEPYWLRREREDAAEERWEVRQARKRAGVRR